MHYKKTTGGSDAGNRLAWAARGNAAAGRRRAASWPACRSRVHAAAKKNTLVLGLDISDTISLDPAREAQYTPPLTVTAAYESLVTMTPGDYLNVKPALATAGRARPTARVALHAARRRKVQQRQSRHRRRREVDARAGDERQGPAVAVSGRDRQIEVVDPHTIDIS